MKHFNKLIVLVLVLVTTGSFAQETKWGVRLGVGLPNIKSTDDNIYSKDYQTVAGFDGGVFLDYGLTENFSIKTELYYARKGGERNGIQPVPPANLKGTPLEQIAAGEPIYADFDSRAVFNYIGIPVLAKYEWNLGDKWGVYANAGLYVEFILNPEQEVSSATNLPITDADGNQLMLQVAPGVFYPVSVEEGFNTTTDIDADLADMDFGAVIGAGVSYQLTSNSELIFDARGTYGFIPLQNDKATYGTVHMGGFVFSVGYGYTFKQRSKKATPAVE